MLPKRIKLKLPYFEGSENIIEIDADLEIIIPKNESEKLRFALYDAKSSRTLRDAVNGEVEKIKDSLDKWMFVNGKF